MYTNLIYKYNSKYNSKILCRIKYKITKGPKFYSTYMEKTFLEAECYFLKLCARRYTYKPLSNNVNLQLGL